MPLVSSVFPSNRTMDQKNPTPSSATTAPPNTPATPASSAAISQPTEPPPQPQPQQQPQQQTAPPPTSQSLPQQSTPPQPPSSATTTPIATPTPNPSPTPRPSAPVSHTQSQPAASAANARPHALHRPWQHPHPHSHFPQFSSLPTPSSPSPVSSAPPPSSTSAISGTQPRGGVAIGVPASPAPSSFSPTFGQPFGGLGRGPVSIPDSVTNSSNSQVRQGMQGVQGMGMMGSMASSGAQLRPGGIPAHHQQRPVQSSLRASSPSPNNQSPASQNFQGHSFIRSPSVGPVSPSLSTSQSVQSPNQPWLSSGSQGKPPLPSPSYRPQVNSPSLQQRPHIPQQQQSLPATSQQLHIPSAQSQQTLPSQQPQEQYGQLPPSRVSQSLAHSQQTAHSQPITYSQQTAHSQQITHSQQAAHSQQITHSQQMAHSQQITHSQQTAHSQQITQSQQITHSQQIGQQVTHSQQITRVQSSLNQKPSSVPTMQSNSVLPPSQSKAANTVSDESGNRILSKRSIQELVSQIDPSERLDPEVEDILADIADEFIESITTFGCSLAKHRKSDTLEAKDILLHLEKNWNISLPGFGSDEIKTYRKPIVNDIHKERLAAIKKSVLVSEMGNAKHSVGQAAGNAKSNMTKAAANAMFSPNSRGS